MEEDKQAFGLVFGKTISTLEAHSYPLTSVPLALASQDGGLRQALKAALSNYLVSKFNALSSMPMQKAKWTVDDMSVIRSMQSQRTWGEFCQVFVQACMPDKEFFLVALDIVIDPYEADRIREMTQNRRITTTRKIAIGGANQTMTKSHN